MAEWEISPDELTLGGVVGEGEFGIVYSGKWDGTPVAIKVVKASQRLNQQRLAAEVAVLRRVRHPNIVQFLGASTRRNPVTIVTELMNGGSLADALEAQLRPPLRRALEVALDCSRALNYLHVAQPHPIIHRDLKPSNIMLCTGPGKDPLLHSRVAKLTSFGLSRGVPATGTGTSRERVFKMTGSARSDSLLAAALFGHEPCSVKADVYSLAMVMYEMLAGRPPFACTDSEPHQAADGTSRDGLRPQWPRAVAGGFSGAERAVHLDAQDLVCRCWSGDPAQRPACSEIITELEQLIARLPRDVPVPLPVPVRTATTGDAVCGASRWPPTLTPRAWLRIKKIRSALSLCKRAQITDTSVGKPPRQRASFDCVLLPPSPLSLVGAVGEGTHIGGRPRAASLDLPNWRVRGTSPPRDAFCYSYKPS